MAIQAAHGLAAAHAHGILHRDLKPENVVLGHEGVKLLDFGLAKLTEPQAAGEQTEATPLATDEGIWVGTPGYVSPEQLRGLPATPRSDVFALGAVLFEMLSGQRAFKGATKADTLSAILEHDPPPMTVPGRPVPPALDKLVRRCLEKDPDDRRVHSSSLGDVDPARSCRDKPIGRPTAGISAFATLQSNGDITIELPLGTVLDWIPRARTCDFLHVSWDGRYVVFRDGRDRGRSCSPTASARSREPSWSRSRPASGAWPGARRVGKCGSPKAPAWARATSTRWTLEGRRRLVYRSTGNLGLVDSAPDGRMLFHRALDRYGAMASCRAAAWSAT